MVSLLALERFSASAAAFDRHANTVTFMKIVLQNLETLSYAHSHGAWTPDVDAAIGFSGVIGALDYAIKRRFLHVRVAMKFPNLADDVDFPPVHFGL